MTIETLLSKEIHPYYVSHGPQRDNPFEIPEDEDEKLTLNRVVAWQFAKNINNN